MRRIWVGLASCILLLWVVLLPVQSVRSDSYTEYGLEPLQDDVMLLSNGEANVEASSSQVILTVADTVTAGQNTGINLNVMHANPDGEPMKVIIPITNDRFRFPQFNADVSLGDYISPDADNDSEITDVKQMTFNNGGTQIHYYLVTRANGTRQIELEAAPGSSYFAQIIMHSINGLVEPGTRLTLNPQILQPTSGGVAEGDTLAIAAGLEWQTQKNATIKNADGATLKELGSLTNGAAHHIEYLITSTNAKYYDTTGRVNTQEVVISDDFSFVDIQTEPIDSSLFATDYTEPNVSKLKYNGNLLLQVDAPNVAFTPTQNEAGIPTGLHFEYTLVNTDENADLASFTTKAILYMADFKNGDATTSQINNSVNQEAYSTFYEAGNPDRSGLGTYRDEDTDTANRVSVADNGDIEKQAFHDPECNIAMEDQELVSADETVYYKLTVRNNSGMIHTYNVQDRLPTGVTYQAVVGDTPAPTSHTPTAVSWNGVTLNPEQVWTAVVQALVTSNRAYNQYVLTNKANLFDPDYSIKTPIDTAEQVLIYRFPENDTMNIEYGKTAQYDPDTGVVYGIILKNTSDNNVTTGAIDLWPAQIDISSINTDYFLIHAKNPANESETGEYRSLSAVPPGWTITKLSLINITVPAGQTVTVTIRGSAKTTGDTLITNRLEDVGSEGGDVEVTMMLSAIQKRAYGFNQTTHSINDSPLATTDIVNVGDVVVWEIYPQNLSTAAAFPAFHIVDTLPEGVEVLTAEEMTELGTGVTAPVTITHGGSETEMPLIIVSQDDRLLTTGDFTLAAQETATVRVYTKLTQAGLIASQPDHYLLTNTAKGEVTLLGGSKAFTEDATAEIRTKVDVVQSVSLVKAGPTLTSQGDYVPNSLYWGEDANN